jgi:hypothetical protein
LAACRIPLSSPARRCRASISAIAIVTTSSRSAIGDAYPLPLGPSGGQWTYGGHVAGRVCGVDVNFFADYYGRHLAVDGYYRGSDFPVRYSVRDDGQGRHIEGTLGVDIVMTRQSLEVDILRRLNYRRLHLKDEGGDTFVGTVEIFGYEFPYAIRGMHVLFAMPPEDQAVVLPLMLACPTVMPDGHGEQIFGFDLTGESYEGGRHRPIATTTTPKT